MRVGAYGLSLAMIVFVKGRGRPHPAWSWAQAAMAVLLVSVVNPAGDKIVARIASIALYTSILAPMLWVGRVALEQGVLRRVMLVMWGFYTASAVMGVLQVNYPGQFDGATSNNFTEQQVGAWRYQLADGRTILRPKGLSDTPGGASIGGTYAIILGAGLLLTETSLVLRAGVVGGMIAGLFCIFLCAQRTNLVIVALASVTLIAVLVRRKSIRKATTLAAVIGGVATVGTAMAFAIGGTAVIDRFSTLVSGDVNAAFLDNRGIFFEELVQHDVYAFPIGAGLGRWGMVNSYFGGGTDALWAEMQWQSLMFDGGIPLVIIYVGLIGTLVWTSWRSAVTAPSDLLGCWAGVVVGYNVAAVAATFVFPVFSLQLGMEVVFLNACLYGTCRHSLGTAKRDGPDRQSRPASNMAAETVVALPSS